MYAYALMCVAPTWLITFADTDMVSMFDEAYRAQPNNEELGAQDFFANVRTGNWKSAQQVSVACIRL